MKTILTVLILLMLTTCQHSTSISWAKAVYPDILALIESTRTGHYIRKASTLTNYSMQFGIDPWKLAKLGMAESTFRHKLVNKYSGCIGLYQVNPELWGFLSWHTEGGRYVKRLNANKGSNVNEILSYVGVNTHAACIILSNYLRINDGDYRKAFKKYGGWSGYYGAKYPDRMETYLAKVLD